MTKLKFIIDLGRASSRRRCTNYNWLHLHALLATLLLMSSFTIAQVQVPRASLRNLAAASSVEPILSFTAPAPATVTTGGAVTTTLQLTGNADPSRLRVMLNKSIVTDSFSISDCSSTPCSITARLNVAAALKPGWNDLYATLTGKTGNAGIARARFFHRNGASVSASSTAAVRPMASARAGTLPQANASTATTSGVLPPTIAVSLDAIAGLQLGSTNYPSCSGGTSYSFFRFDQTTLQPTDVECLSAASLPALIVGLEALPSGSIVALISPPGTQLPQLDFSSVGGTDFTQKGAPVPVGYQLMGYSQASPGEAYESYAIGSQYVPPNDLYGNLVNTGASGASYAFQPTDSPAFIALANIPGTQSYTVVGYPLTLPFGSTTPTNWSLPNTFTQQQFAPDATGSIGQAGLVTILLSPTDLSALSETFYATGSDPAALGTIASDLAGAANGTIIIITSQGQNPFSALPLGGATPTLASFCAEVAAMGVSEHACGQAGTGGPGTISMVGVMEQNGAAPFNPGYKKLYSSTYETGQNDSGSLTGLFRRDHLFHLVPYQVSSVPQPSLTASTTADSLLAFALPAQVGSAPASPWPMLDTSGHQAAYQYLSNVIVGKVLFGNGLCTVDAAWCNDVRAWYAGSEVQSFAGLDLTSPAYAFPSSATGFTQSDFNDVKGQLQAESVYLNNELNYEAWFNQATNGALVNTGSVLSAAANEIQTSLLSQYTTIPPPPVSLTNQLLSLGSVVAGVGELAGVPGASTASTILHVASESISLEHSSGESSNPALVQVADLITSTNGQASVAAVQYNLALQTELGNYFAGVRSDWFKLQSFGILTSQPSAEGWYVQDTGAAAASAIAAIQTAEARTSFYTQLIPTYFSMDWMYAIPIQGIVNAGYSLSDFNSNWVTSYLGSDYSQAYGTYTWPPPDFAQFSLQSILNSTCQDYGLAASNISISQYSASDYRYLKSWPSSLGDVLMGAPTSTDGLGNLSLSQNAFYDFALTNTILSPVLNKYFYAPNLFGGQPWGNNVSCPSNLSATPAQDIQGAAMLVVQPSASRVAPGGSITVAVSLQPSGPAATSVPTGTIAILLNNKPVTIASLVPGTPPAATATLNLSASSLSPGTYTFTVAYGGDNNFAGATATMNLQVLAAVAATTTNLKMPPAAYQGQDLQFQATVTSAAGIPTGTVTFEDGSTNLGSATVDGTGNASLSLNNLGVGSHSVTAVYTPADILVYGTSQSQATSLVINPVDQDIALSLSADSVTVPAGASSAPVKLTVSSVSSFSGQVSFTCVGLPLGMACSFSPPQGALPASGAVSTNVTVSQSPVTSSASIFTLKGYAGLIGFSMSALLAFRIAKGRRVLFGPLCVWAVFTVGIAVLAGCGGGTSPTRQVGTTTILVDARSGNVSRDIPLTVNIQ